MRTRSHRTRSLVTLGLLTVGLGVPLAFTGPVANADPKHGDTFDLTCGSTTYHVVVNGNGEWTPAHDLRSNKVFIPHAFGTFYGVIRNPAGEVVDSFSEPGSVQGSGKQKNGVSCVYSFVEVSDGSDPEFPAGSTFTGSGSVTGQIAGH